MSSLASRWPFVCDDLLISVRPPLAGLLTPVVLPPHHCQEKVRSEPAATKEVATTAKERPARGETTRKPVFSTDLNNIV